jgi:transposase
MDKVVKNFIGVDISKKSIDVAVIVDNHREEIKYQRFTKSKSAYGKMIRWLKKLKVSIDEQTVFCMEYTGLYNRGLLGFLTQQKVLIWVEMAIQIKRSLGMQRGKSDKVDAMRIAAFAYKNREEIKVWTPVDEAMYKLKDLLAQRERLMETKKRLEVPLKELEEEGLKKEAKELERLQQSAIEGVGKSLSNIEKSIKEIITRDQELQQLFERISSVTGVGKVIAWYIIAFTNGFSRLITGKQLACYCGVVPFEHTSGTTIKGKPSVSHMANKTLKTLLHMGAMSAITHDEELKKYYERKVKEGKNKMSVLNAVRNKLVLRIAAVIRDKRKFKVGSKQNVKKVA